MTMKKVRDIAAIAGLLNVLIVGFVGVFTIKIWEFLMGGPEISMSCPSETRLHEVMVFGERSKQSTSLVELFVSPQDGSHTYYSQGKPDKVAIDGGSWAKMARLGNPFGIGHKKRPPLDYDLVAVLRNANYRPVDPTKFTSNGASFGEWLLEQPGIDRVATCRINRKPELALVCLDTPRITSPTPSCCPYNANGHACNEKCNPKSINLVRSPVLMQWDSDALMQVELYQSPSGRSVEGFPRKMDRSGQKVDLLPGTYEMKIRHYEDDDCISSSWFEVTPGP